MRTLVFLRHDQSNNLDAVQTKLKDAEWWNRFPPAGVEMVSWTVTRPDRDAPPAASKLTKVQCRTGEWGVFRTECYPAYDFIAVRERIKERVRKGGK